MNLPINLKKTENLWLFIILSVAAALRFYHYGSFSYSNDELSALNRLHYDTFAELVQKGFYVDGHPGGVQVFLWQWVRHFGDNEWVVRLPFVLIGILSVWMSYKVARYMFGAASGLFTAAAISFLQFPLLYSQIARPYGPGMLFGLMLVYFWLQIFFDEEGSSKTSKPKLIHYVGFALSAALCMYTHYFSFLFALIVGFSGFVVVRKSTLFQYIGAALVAAMLFVPHIPVTLNHLTYKGVGLWLGVPGKGWILQHLFFIFDQSVFILVVFFVTLLALLYFNREFKSRLRYRLFLGMWFLAPMLIGYFYSVKVNPVLQHPVLIFTFPCFIMLIFSYAGNEFNNVKRWILGTFLLSGVLSTTLINTYYQKQHFGEFKDIARLTSEWQQHYGDTLITKAININNPLYIDYYLDRYNSKARFDLYAIEGTDGVKALAEIVRNSHSPYFLYATTKPTPFEIEDIIRSFYPFVIEMKNYGEYSSVMLFGKDKGESFVQANHLVEIRTLKAALNQDTLAIRETGKPETAHKMDSLAEYSPGIELSLDELKGKENLTLIAETDLFSEKNTGSAVLVISVETADGVSLLWKGAEACNIEIPARWGHLINTLKIDSGIPKGAKLKVYFWNKDKKVLYIRDLKCTIFSH